MVTATNVVEKFLQEVGGAVWVTKDKILKKLKHTWSKDDDGLDEVLDNMGAMSMISSRKKDSMRITPPHQVLILYKDSDLFKHIRLDVRLLAGTTTHGLVYTVDKTSWYFILKYIMPHTWLTPHILECQDEWSTRGTNLGESLAHDISKLKERYNNDEV